MTRLPARHLVVSALLVVVTALQAAWFIGTTSATFDEQLYLQRTHEVYTRGDFTTLILEGNGPLPILVQHALPVLLRPLSFRTSIAFAQAITVVVFGLPLVLIVYWWLVRQTDQLTGFVGAAIVALSPNVVAHLALASTDACFVFTAVLSLWTLHLYLEQQT